MTRFYFSFLVSENCGFLDMGRPRWRKDGSVIHSYHCFWALPAQSLLGPRPKELMTTSHCLIWDSPNLEGQVPVCISPRNRVAQLYSRALEFAFRRFLRLAALWWRYSNTPPWWIDSCAASAYNISAQIASKTPFLCYSACLFLLICLMYCYSLQIKMGLKKIVMIVTESLPSNGSCIVVYFFVVA
jgi:hypothetical protein